jgi:uncharacterized protein YbjT (DUF2867 family)
MAVVSSHLAWQVRRVEPHQIGSTLGPYRAAADAIEASDLKYTILRPAWVTDRDEIDFEVALKGEPFKAPR